MPLPKFAYLAPANLKEACALLVEHGDKAKVKAGGTDLLIRLGIRAMTPDFVISLARIPGLDYVTFNPEKGLAIGALASLGAVAEHPEVNKHYPALAQSAGHTATVQIRNMGTLVGNLCNAAPSADNATPLLVYGAEVVVVHPGGERVIPLVEFFRGPGLTALEKGEIVKEVRVPLPGPRSGSNYQKLSPRSKVDIAAVGVSALVELDDNGALSQVRLALGAVAPVPLRARRAENLLQGRAPAEQLLAQAGKVAADESSPITDVRASAAYRGLMVEVLTVRALQASLAMAEERKAGCEQ